MVEKKVSSPTRKSIEQGLSPGSFMDAQVFSPLYNFSSSIKTFELIAGVTIQQTSSAITKFLNHERNERFTLLEPTPFMIAINQKVDLHNGLSGMIAFMVVRRRLVDDCITALRLCHSGDVIHGDLLPKSLLEPPKNAIVVTGPIATRFSKKVEISPDNTEYRLTKRDIPVVKSIITILTNMHKDNPYYDKPTPLDISMDRFNYSYQDDQENRLLDHMISLESIYINDDKELGFKLGMRMAFLMGASTKERKQIFGAMKSAYDIRGGIMHGGKRPDPNELCEILPITEEYLRKSLRQFVLMNESGMSLKAIKDKLDENIISSGVAIKKQF